MKDHFSVDICIGDIVAYPLRSGSSLWIEEAQVTEISTDYMKVVKPNGRKTVIRNFKNCIVCPANGTPRDQWRD